MPPGSPSSRAPLTSTSQPPGALVDAPSNRHEIPAADDVLTWFGAVEVEHTPGWSRGWRLPQSRIRLFPGDMLQHRGTAQAGVRVVFGTDATMIGGESVSIEDESSPLREGETGVVDLVVDGHRVSSAVVGADGTFTFEGVAPGEKTVEVWLPQFVDFRLVRLWVGDAARVWRATGTARPRLITYGSSITQCRTAASPTRTWPALVARELEMDLTCLGFAGQCHLDPMIARMIRDLPAELIITCLGINVHDAATFNQRSFLPAVLGFLSTVRDGHPGVPILVLSPIASPRREQTVAGTGMTLAQLRAQVGEAVGALRSDGDSDVHLLNGLDVLSEAHAGMLPDGTHPDTEGYAHMAAAITSSARDLVDA